jgi:DNA-binding transcriptional LysR family regulator
MTLDQLRIFLAVAERQHITRASEHLGLTQSAVSAAIAGLETRHAVKLFDRVGRRIVLTEAGKALIREAQLVVAQVETAQLILEDFSSTPRGRLRIHASQTVASYWLPARLVMLHDKYPAITVEMRIGNTSQVADAVQEGSADLGLVEGEVSHLSLHRQVVARDELSLVMAADHPWATRDDLHISEYTRQDWVLRETGSGTRSEFEAALNTNGLRIEDLTIALELPSNEAVLTAVAAGTCLSVLSHRAVAAAEAAGRIVAFPVPYPDRPFSVLSHPDRHRTRAMRVLLEILSAS